MNNIRKLTLFSGIFVSLLSLHSKTTVSTFFSDEMVLQRDQVNSIWGWEDESNQVQIKIGAHTQTCEVTNGSWEAELPTFPAGGSHVITIAGSEEITINDVCFGDVYVISGQSNMELPVRRVTERYPNVVNESVNPDIRMFRVPTQYEFSGPSDKLENGSWKKANLQNTPDFSAIGYFFAKEINELYDVPVGVISTAVGGSPIECWISEENLSDDLESIKELRKYQQPGVVEEILANNNRIYSEWGKLTTDNDEGLKNTPWYEKDLDTANWKTIKVPGKWEQDHLAELSGVIWLRRTFFIPQDAELANAKLYLGTIVDADTAYVNGEQVGNTTYRYPPRIYTIPAEKLHHGKNNLTVRVEVNNRNGEFTTDKLYQIKMGDQVLPLQGTWNYKIGCKVEPREPTVFVRWKPTVLYNAMIAPLKNYGAKAVLWYQGESNAGRAKGYSKLMEKLLSTWRTQWANPELPFITVQLANFMEPQDVPMESGWAELREEQRKANKLPFTRMAVTLDLGEWNDIHPLNKKDVAHRLVLGARSVVYNEDLVHTGPIPLRASVDGDSVIVEFKDQGSSLKSCQANDVIGFEVAGVDRVFHKVTGKISNNQIHLSAVENLEPQWIRYAWANNPISANLYNEAGLPASSFEIEITP